MIEARGISKRYLAKRRDSRHIPFVTALDDVQSDCSLTAFHRCFGWRIRSLSKSTFGRCSVSSGKPDSGAVWFENRNLLTLPSGEWRALRCGLQFIFQDAGIAMNPSFSALDVVEEPLLIQTNLARKARRQQALTMMEQVGLPPKWGERPATEFSGGERQRLAIARVTLVLKPASPDSQ